MSKGFREQDSAERTTMVISILILAAILGLATWSSVTTGEEPPLITVEAMLDEVRETDSGYYVPISITNDGGKTAQDVMVTGKLSTGEGEPETAEITIDFLAGGETERAELIFPIHPNEGEFTVAPTSYLVP